MNQTNELTVMSTTLLATGTYVCQATNGATSTTSTSATLTVLSEFIVMSLNCQIFICNLQKSAMKAVLG